MTSTSKVVVIGGGYAGVIAANRMTQSDDVTVTLITPRPVFVERMRLHQLVGGSDDAVVDYQDLLSTRVGLVADRVTGIDASTRTVELASGEPIGYDYLIYAVGSGSADHGVPGAEQFAYPIANLEQAEALRSALGAVPMTAPLIVVGAGPTGIETAAELAESGRSVTLVCGGVLGSYLHERGRRSVANQLARLGATVLEGAGTKVTAVRRDTVRLEDGRELPGAITVWTAGFGVPDLAVRSGLTTDSVGRLLTDETLTSVDDPRIVGAGDSAAPSDLPYRMSAFAAQRLGAHAADTVLRRIAGDEPETLSLGFLGLCVGLGRHHATLQGSDTGDIANGVSLHGRLVAALVKEAGSKAVVGLLAKEGRKPGSLSLRRVDPTRQERARVSRAELLSR